MGEKDKQEKLTELISLANTSDKKLSKMNYKDKQKVFKAKSNLCKLFHNSSKGTYINWKKRIENQNKGDK